MLLTGFPVGADRRHHRTASGEARSRMAAVHGHHPAGEEGRVPAAGQARQGALAGCRDANDGRVRSQRASAARDRRVGDIAGRGGGGQGRAELVQVLAAFQVDELGQREARALHGLGGGTGDGEEETLVGIRDRAVVVPVHHDRTDGVIGHDQWHDGQGTEARVDGGGEVGPLPPQIVEGLRKEGDVVAQDRAVELQGPKEAVDRLVGSVAETAQRAELALLADEGEGGGVDVQLVTQGGEHGVGHLSGVCRRGERAGHGLHALCGLGRHPPAPLVPGLRPGRPQLHVALAPEVGDPHGHCRGGQLGQDAAACGSARRSYGVGC